MRQRLRRGPHEPHLAAGRPGLRGTGRGTPGGAAAAQTDQRGGRGRIPGAAGYGYLRAGAEPAPAGEQHDRRPGGKAGR